MKSSCTWLIPMLCALLCACGGGDGPATYDTTSSPDHSATDPGDALSTLDSSTSVKECAYLDDGVCDEPTNCALGTDNKDCAATCDDEEMYWLYGAACAFRSQPDHSPPLPPAVQKGGLNQTGYFDRTVEVTLGDSSGSRPRHYRLYVPAHYDPDKAWPLMIMMPGHRVDIYTLANYTHLEAAAEANNFLLVYAEQEWRASAFKWAWWTDWSWTGKPNSNPDVAFLIDLIDGVAKDWSVDRQRVYGVGHSRGGAMAYIAAFELADTFAALCSQSGFTEFGYDSHVNNWTGRHTPMMLVHGTVDSDVPVDRSDAMYNQMQGLGWSADVLVYKRLENVAHRWQPWLNQEMWDFLSSHTLPPEGSP